MAACGLIRYVFLLLTLWKPYLDDCAAVKLVHLEHERQRLPQFARPFWPAGGISFRGASHTDSPVAQGSPDWRTWIGDQKRVVRRHFRQDTAAFSSRSDEPKLNQKHQLTHWPRKILLLVVVLEVRR